MKPSFLPATASARTTSRHRDARGDTVSGATARALDAYERALAAFQCWRGGADTALASALQEAPGFLMAHVLRAWMLLGSRDHRLVQAARPLLAQAAGLPANDRERAHLAAMASVLADDYEGAKHRLGTLLHAHPRDVLALQMAHALDHLTGDAARMHARVARVLPAWSSGVAGHAAVLAMHAFSLQELGEYAHAEQVARAALALNPADARSHHVMAHVFEMTGRAGAGVRWMDEHRGAWQVNSTVATHCAWHLALFHLELGDVDRALALYDDPIRAGASAQVGDLVDAAALLWRVRLHDADAGTRWAELASAWSSRLDDGFCSFNDLHAMLAFVGAQDWPRAGQLLANLERAQANPTRYGASTRQIGLPACRGLLAYGRGDAALAVTLLASLPALAHRFGGSHAQRDVLRLTLADAAGRLGAGSRRPVRPPSPALRPGALLAQGS